MASMHEFLDALLADPAKLTKFNKGGTDAEAVMKSENLSQANQQLLKTGTTQQIRDELKNELNKKANATANAYVIRMA